MSADQFAEQVAGIAALADPIRRDLYLHVSREAAPVSRDQAAEALGIARHVAKFHLDKLAEEGLLDTDFRRPAGRGGPGAGRPTKLYKRSSRQLSVSVPERRYDVAAELLASAIDSTADGSAVTDAVNAVATWWGRRIGEEAQASAGRRPSAKRLVGATCGALAEHGYEPRRDGGTVTLSNCPFDALARDHTQLVCGMNFAIMNALTACVAKSKLTARLEPASGRCCVVLDAAGRDQS
jgi:predicted ArsR family transcriptional regulator